MNSAVDRLRQAWDDRTRREQRMLVVMALVVAAAVAWVGVVRPTLDWRAEAARDRVRAERTLVEVRTALARTAPARPAPPVAAGGLEPLLRQTAEAAGLQITTGMDPSGRMGFRLAEAAPAAFFGWLAVLDTTHRLQPASLSVVENANASLQVEGSFQAATSGPTT